MTFPRYASPRNSPTFPGAGACEGVENCLAPPCFVARQPILDAQGGLAGYELLFRDGFENRFPGVEFNLASLEVIRRALTIFGYHELTGGHLAYVNVTRDVLLSDTLHLLPPEFTVIEILETVTPDVEVIAAIRALREAGYRIALDDFVWRAELAVLLPLADIVKIDLASDGPEIWKATVARCRPFGVTLLAEKVEDRETFELCKSMGFELFQGYFFERPEIVCRQEVPALKVNFLHLVEICNRPVLEFDDLEKVIRHDLGLTYKLLRLVNAAAHGLPQKVISIRQALILLGSRTVAQWATVVSFAQIGGAKAEVLLRSSLMRARLMEQIAPPELKDAAFLCGMLSLADALTGQPLESLLEQLSLDPQIIDGLLDPRYPLGRLLSLVRSLERGRWRPAIKTARALDLRPAELAPALAEALQWTERVLEL